MQQTATIERLYGLNETRQFLGVGNTKLFELIRTGQLSARKIGSRTVVPESELIRFQSQLPPARNAAGDAR